MALTSLLALLSSALLAVGAHEHLGPHLPEVVCSIDHGSESSASGAGLHAATERPHRHHCASCQLAGKSTAQKPQPSAIPVRPTAEPDRVDRATTLENAALDPATGPRGPPIS